MKANSERKFDAEIESLLSESPSSEYLTDFKLPQPVISITQGYFCTIGVHPGIEIL